MSIDFSSPDNKGIDPAEIAKVRELRNFSGSWKEFWREFLSRSSQFIKAQSGVLAYKANDEWKQAGSWKNARFSGSQDKVIASVFAKWLEENSTPTETTWHQLSGELPEGVSSLLIIPLATRNPEETILALYIVNAENDADAIERLRRLSLISDMPVSFQEHLDLENAKSSAESFAIATDLATLINRQKRFIAANMTLCNELASRFSCERVSIGWLKEREVALTAISHMEKFEKKMDAARGLQASMEESLEQNCEILWPPSVDTNYVSRDHTEYASSQGINNIFSIPLRKDDEAVGVIVFERSAVFTERDQLCIRLIGDQVTQRMLDLQRTDRWFGARFYNWLKEKFQSLLNVEFSFQKALCLVGVFAALWLVFWRMPFKVKAPFILRAENVRFVPAPEDGYIKAVNIEKGDFIAAGSTLLNLDIRELLLEESASVADKTRFEREIAKARAENELVEMRIAQARLQQAEARLEKIRYYIEQAKIISPFDGVVVEGDLKEKIGVPVQQGDLLYKIAQLDSMFSELKVDEDDIHELSVEHQGHLAFASKPDEKFPIVVERIEPMAQDTEEGNIFIVRCSFVGEPADWWRPGMSGIAKIKVGKRSPLFIFTHKTMDYLRLRFWWF